MKKLILIAAICAICIGGIAQTNSFGIIAGAGRFWLKEDGGGNVNPLQNIHFSFGNVGLSFIHNAKDHLGFEADVTYSKEGGKTEKVSSSFSSYNNTLLKYVRVPLKAIYFFGKPQQKWTFAVKAGPSIGFLVGGSTTTKVTNYAPSGPAIYEDYYKAVNAYKKVDVGIASSAGLIVRVANKISLSADVNYYHGLSNVNKEGFSTSKLYNRNLGLNAGLSWAMGK